MKIAYIGEHHHTSGTYYRQRLTISPEEYNSINEKMTEIYNKNMEFCKKNHTITSEQMLIMTYTKPLDASERNGNKIYINISQLHAIWSFYPENKRFCDYNTLIYIK